MDEGIASENGVEQMRGIRYNKYTLQKILLEIKDKTQERREDGNG